MKNIFLLCLLITFSANAALTTEDLETVFISDPSQRPLTVGELDQIEGALFELGHIEVWDALVEKLGIIEKEGIALYIRSCNTGDDTLGTYRRGSSRRFSRPTAPDLDLNDVLGIWGGQEIEEAIDQAYTWYTENSGAYVSLVITQWPLICIRPGEKLGSVLNIFAHEVQHFIGDDEKETQFLQYEDEEDFVHKYLHKPGGEFEAFQAGGKISTTLQRDYSWNNNSRFLALFDSAGVLIQPAKLESYILETLRYKNKFITSYRQKLVDAFNRKVHSIESLHSFLDYYKKTVDYNSNRITSIESNIAIYRENIAYYERHNNPAEVLKYENFLQSDSLESDRLIKALVFYEGIVTTVEQQILEAKEFLENRRQELDL